MCVGVGGAVLYEKITVKNHVAHGINLKLYYILRKKRGATEEFQTEGALV